MQVIKRDGSKAVFDKQKIFAAISKATNETAKPMENSIVGAVTEVVRGRCFLLERDVSVEEIQEMVETELMRFQEYDTAKAYIRYRYKRNAARDTEHSFFSEVGKKLRAKNVENQNANVDEYSFGGRIGEAANLMMKEYALNFCVSDMARNNHLNNEIYIHDLSAYAIGNHNCLSVPLDDLLANGFKTRQTDIRPANSINTAFQLVAVLFQIQSLQQFGGVSATHLDWTMVPYVRKSFAKHYEDGLRFVESLSEEEIEIETSLAEGCSWGDTSINSDEYSYDRAWMYAFEMTKRELKQAVEGMYHNLNTLQSRSGNQLPFSSINYGTCTLNEGRMVTKALLEGSISGVGKLHLTPIFPCGIFQMMEGVNKKPEDPNWDLFQLALKSTALRLYPNYANCDWSGNAGYDKNDPKTYFSTINKPVAFAGDGNRKSA